MPNFTEEDIKDIIRKYSNGVRGPALGEQYGVSRQYIYRILHGKVWKHIPRPKNLTFQSKRAALSPLSDIQLDVINGSLLGDGSIELGNYGQARFCKTQRSVVKDYLDWHDSILFPYSSSLLYRERSGIGHTASGKIIRDNTKVCKSYEYRTICHSRFTNIHKRWYVLEGNGRYTKRVPDDITLNPRTVAVWFADDGTNHKNHRECYFHTQSFDDDGLSLLITAFLDLEIKASVTLDGHKMPILRVSSDDYVRLIKMIRPHMPWGSMSYKTIIHNYKRAK